MSAKEGKVTIEDIKVWMKCLSVDNGGRH